MSRFLPLHKHFDGSTAQITDRAETAIVEDKLLHQPQSEMFPVEFKELQSGIPVKRSGRIAGYSLFFGLGGVACSTGRIQRLA